MSQSLSEEDKEKILKIVDILDGLQVSHAEDILLNAIHGIKVLATVKKPI